MENFKIGEAEKQFILTGVEQNLRADGRQCEDYRNVEVETGVLPQSAGSSSVRVGSTYIICSVKCEMGKPLTASPDEGRLELNVECSATATPGFVGKSGDEIGEEIKASLEAAYRSCGLDLRPLCLVSAKHCWIAFVDLILLESDGNFLDAASMAVKAAVKCTKLPRVIIRAGNNKIQGDDFDITVATGDDSGSLTIDASHLPCFVTLHKIGNGHLVDATREEEACSLARMSQAVREDGYIVSVLKAGGGGLDLESISEMAETGQKVGVQLHKSMNKTLEIEEKIRSTKRMEQ